MSVPLSDTRLFGVVFDRPDADRIFAWGPFADRDAAARFAEFVETEIDPARVIPWADAQALPGVRVADPVAELLSWRESVAPPQTEPAVDTTDCPACGHLLCKGDGQCGAILTVFADGIRRCQCTGVDATQSAGAGQ